MEGDSPSTQRHPFEGIKTPISGSAQAKSELFGSNCHETLRMPEHDSDPLRANAKKSVSYKPVSRPPSVSPLPCFGTKKLKEEDSKAIFFGKNWMPATEGTRAYESPSKVLVLLIFSVGVFSATALCYHLPRLLKGSPQKHDQHCAEPVKSRTDFLSRAKSTEGENATGAAVFCNDGTGNDGIPQSYGAENIGEVAREYIRQKKNMLFSKDVLAQDLLAKDEAAVSHLRQFLIVFPDLGDIARSGDLPAVLAERMAALDLLDWLSAPDAASKFGQEVQQEAVTALRSICGATIPATAYVAQRKVMVADMYDAFVALTHSDPLSAFEAYRALPNEEQRKVMMPAIMTGLVDRGIARAEMDAEFAKLLIAAQDS